MPRNKTVSVNGKDIIVQEKRIKELEGLVNKLFPGAKGKIANIDIEKAIDRIGFDLLYKEFPDIFTGLTKEDIQNAYPSELEELVEAFIDVNFTGIKRLVAPLMSLIQTSLTSQKRPA